MSEPRGKSFETEAIGWVAAVIVIGGLGWFVVPNFIKVRSTSAANPCINNLRQMDAAANQFALENSKTNGEVIHYPNDLTPYIKLNSAGKIPGCPQGGIYQISMVGETPTCSLSNSPGHTMP